MDAWLLKLKEHNDKLEMSIRELKENRDSWHRLYVLVNKKLEAVKNYALELSTSNYEIETLVGLHLEKILGVEE